MTWQPVERRVAGQTTKPASISLKAIIRKGVAVSRPSCIVTIRYGYASQLGWKSKEPVGVVIGSGEHAGLLRIIRNSAMPIAKVRILHRGGFSLNLGHIAQFGMEPEAKQSTDARIIDPDTVEVVLPSWGDVPLIVDDEDAEIDSTMRSAPAPKVNANGVTVVFEDENEHLLFGDKSLELTTRQAKFIASLVGEMPGVVNKSAIKKRLWGSQPPKTADAVIDQIWRDLTAALGEIGLDLRKDVSGFGLSTMVAAA